MILLCFRNRSWILCKQSANNYIKKKLILMFSMRLLINTNGGGSKFSPMWHFDKALSKIGVKSLLVSDSWIADRSLRRIHKWRQSMNDFYDLIEGFTPDVILSAGGHFGTASTKLDIPILTSLGGDIWTEMEQARAMHYNHFPKTLSFQRWYNILQRGLCDTSVIMPISKHLEDIVRMKLPGKPTYTLRSPRLLG